MISEGESYVLQHWSGRYLWVRGHYDSDSAGCHIPGERMRRIFGLEPSPMLGDRVRIPAILERWIEGEGWDRDQFEIVRAPVCACCGDTSPQSRGTGYWSPYRCWRHGDRNPCAIEGCTRTRAAKGRLDNSAWICRDHWRAFCPPRSLRRRAFLAYFRKAKKLGYGPNDRWPDELEESYWRFWRRLISNARHKAAGGNLDIAQIERLFGI